MKRSANDSRTKLERPAFGPAAHNTWQRDGNTVSLVRGTRRKRPVRFYAEPESLEIDVAASALVVIDMQNDFCHKDGWFARKGVKLAGIRRPIGVIAGLLPAWRAAGGTVVWLNWGVRPDRLNLPPTVQFKGKRTVDGVGYAEPVPGSQGRSLVAGEWGAQVVDELEVAPQDITVYKHRLSGFWDNELDSVLRGQRIDTLLFAGVNTDRCVFSTLQDAGFLGYDCVLLADACGTPSPSYVARAIHFIVRQLHGFVATTPALLAALSSLSRQPSKPKKDSP